MNIHPLRSFRARRRVLVTWLVSYCIIILLPMAFWMVIQQITSQVILQQTHGLHEGILQVIAGSIDHQIENIEKTLSLVGTDSLVSARIQASQQTSPKDRFLDSQLRVALQNYASRDHAIRSIAIYFFNRDYVISSETAAMAPLYFEAELAADYQLAYADWKEMMLAPHHKEYLVMDSRNGGRSVACLLSLPAAGTDRSNGTQATLMILLQPSALTSIIGKVDPDDRVVTSITDEAGLLLAQTGHAPSQGDFITAEGFCQLTGWRCSALISSYTYLDKFNYVRRLAWVGMLSCLLLCSFITYFSIQQNYTPLKQLINHMEMRLHRSKGELSEYVYLRRSIDDMMNSNQVNDTFIRQQTETLFGVYVSQLLLGYAARSGNMGNYLATLGFEVSTRFAVLLASNGGHDPKSLARSLSIGDSDDCFLFGRIAVVDGQTALLADCADWDGEPFRENIRQRYQSALAAIPGLRLACSEIHATSQGISTAFDEAQYTLDYLNAQDASGILFYSEVADGKNSAVYYPIAEEQHLLAAVKSGDFALSQKKLEQLWQANQNRGKIDLETAYLLRMSILSTLIKAGNESPYQGDTLPLDPGLLRRQPLSVAEIQTELHDAVRRMCECANSSCHGGDDELKNNILTFISQNYNDPNLSVESICKQFRRSSSSISRLFRETTGDGLLHQINYTRVEKAKSVLLQSERTVNETALAVGFTNANTFVRLFKKYEGMTPGRYREIVAAAQALDRPGDPPASPL